MSFREYVEHGWAVTLIRPGFKGPVGEAAKGWQKRENACTDPTVADSYPGAGLLHAWSGTCALDIDNMAEAEKWLKSKGISLHGLRTARSSVHISSGREGRDKLLYLLDTPLPSKKFGPYKAWSEKSQKEETYHAFELRCANRDGESVQDVLPPTIHPQTGRPYEWTFGDEILGDWRFPPPLPDALLELWRAETATVLAPATASAPSGATHPEIEKLLATRDPDCDYDTWIRTGAAVHHETRGSVAGFQLWDAWSAKGSKYKGSEDLVSHWNSFRADAKGAVTLGSLRRESVADVADFPATEPVAAPTPGPAPAEGVAAPSEPSGSWDDVKALLEPRLVFVRSQDSYFDMATHGDGYLTANALRHVFCPHMPTIEKVDAKGKVTKVKPDPVVFLQNSRNKVIVDAVGLNPAAGRIYQENRRTFVNRYYPEKTELLSPLPHEREAFLALWNRIEDPIFAKWLMKFYAHALQKPGIKITAAPLVYSAETGTGKNTLCKIIPQLLFGSRWVRTMSGQVLGSQFNDTVGETWWLYLEELRAGTTKPERTAVTNRIKSWVTDDTLEVHPKGGKPFDIVNRLQITATSNFDDALQIDNNDRRWAVCELPKPMSEQESTDIYHFLKSDRAPGVLRHIFSQVSLTGFNPTARAPSTIAKVVMIRAGIGVWESNLIERMVRGLPPFNRDIFAMQSVFDEMAGRNGPPSVHAVRSLLTKSPFSCQQLPNGGQRLYAWRNFDKWRKQPESVRSRYLETGIYPLHVKWDMDIPENLVKMSSDGPALSEPPPPEHDLL